VQIISRKPLADFWRHHPDAESSLRAWYHEVEAANWTSPNDIKESYRSASILGNNRVAFNIAGNKYRLIVAVLYRSHKILIKFVGNHNDYDNINAITVEP